ncbi:MAG TPA: hypothetical protein VJ770_13405 [Stellaceae bacterium]|nr:hypothetical protein [Stellaceae bacterium]
MVNEVHGARLAAPVRGGDVVVRPGAFRRISWGGVFAGLFLVLAIQLLLSILGFGVGLSLMHPGRGGTPGVGNIGLGVAIWWVVSYWIALVIGSYAAARLAGIALRFDGVLHGLVTWAFALTVTSIIAIYLLTTAVGGIIGGAAGVVGGAVSAAGQALKAAVPEAAQAVGLSTGQIQQRAGELLQPTDPSRMNNEQAAAQLARDAATYLAGGKDAQRARNQIIGIIAARLGISRDDAAKRFDQWSAEVKSTIAGGTAQVADQATGMLGQASLGVFGALLLGAIFSGLGGAWGTRPRLLVEEIPRR